MQQQGNHQNPLGSQQYDKDSVNREGSTQTLSWIARNSKRTHRATQVKNKNDPTPIKEEHDMYAKVYNMKNIKYTNQTGALPIRSSPGSRYLMILLEINMNTILVAPMKNQTSSKMSRAYKTLIQWLKVAGINPHNTSLTTRDQTIFSNISKKRASSTKKYHHTHIGAMQQRRQSKHLKTTSLPFWLV